MRDLFATIAALLIGIAILTAVGFELNYAGLASLNFFGPKYEDAQRNIVQHSLRRQEGVSEGIGALCLNMRLASDFASKRAFAELIIQQASATGTTLTPPAGSCVSEANTLVLGV